MIESSRFYRDMHRGRFHGFTVGYKETDLWIGVDKFDKDMPEATLSFIKELRMQLENYIDGNPLFLLSFKPITAQDAKGVAKKMIDASTLAQVGPMAAVAGAIADEVGTFLRYEFNCKEIIVENGGDIFVQVEDPILVSIYAGSSPLSGKIALEIPPSRCGICTSSGTVGPSISFGKADAATVVAPTAAVADAFATFYGNQIKVADDVEKIFTRPLDPHIDTLLVVIGDKIGVFGKHELQIVESGDNHEGC